MSRMRGQQDQTTLRVSHGRVSVLGGRIERVLRRDVVGRSVLLSDLVASCNEQVTSLSTPLQGEKFAVWIAYAGASNKAKVSFMSQLCDEQLVNALEARSDQLLHYRALIQPIGMDGPYSARRCRLHAVSPVLYVVITMLPLRVQRRHTFPNLSCCGLNVRKPRRCLAEKRLVLKSGLASVASNWDSH